MNTNYVSTANVRNCVQLKVSEIISGDGCEQIVQLSELLNCKYTPL